MRVDYDKIAPDYDRHRRPGGPYMAQLVRVARDVAARDVLELGCGTGNGTAAFLEQYPCRLTGLDPSPGMLEKAREKVQGVRWLRASATEIPLPSNCVDYVFGVFFLHHVPDTAAVARECARVLRRGAAAFVTASTSFIKMHPLNRYFPSLAPIDLARFRTGEEIESALRCAGFTDTRVGTFRRPEPQPVDWAYVEKIAGKFISTYELIPEQEFESGLARLKSDVAQAGGALRDPVQWEWTSVVGMLHEK